jgi:hypothetical protein
MQNTDKCNFFMGRYQHTVHAALCGALVGIFGCCILFYPLFATDPATTLWGDQFDARLLHWIAEWGYQIIFIRHDPLSFWNAPSFYPHPGSLAYSDSLLSAQIFYAPLRLLGVSSFTALYGTLACVAILGCILSAIALQRIGGLSRYEIALIVFVSHFGLSITSYLHHYQLFGFQLAPPFFLFLYLYLRDWQRGDLAAVVFCFGYGVCFATYLAPMLVVLGVVVAAPQAWQALRRNGLAGVAKRIGVGSAIVVIASAALIFSIQLRPYWKADALLAPQSFSESALYSARLTSFLLPARGGNSLWYGPAPGEARFGDAARAFFPGIIISSLTCCFLLAWLVVACRSREVEKATTLGADPMLVQYLGILLGASLVLALGPYLHGHASFKLPFYFLSSVVPGLERVRAPGRFGIVVGLPAVYFSILLLRVLLRNHHSKVLALACGALVLIDSLPTFKTYPYVNNAEGLYRRIAAILPANAPLVELPVAGGDFLRTIVRVTNQLHGTLIHQGRIVLGYGSKESPEAAELGHLDLKVQRGVAAPQTIVEFCKRVGVSHLLLRLDRYTPKIRKRWMDLIRSNSSFITLQQSDSELLLRLEFSSQPVDVG